MRQYFEFDGVKSSNYGLYISGNGVYNTPTRDVELVSVPGRNGDIVQDNGRFDNVEIKYPVFITKNFQGRADQVNAWLMSKLDYSRLEDSYRPNYYRMARIADGIRWDPKALLLTGTGTIRFDCKPQLWLKEGEIETKLVSGRIVNNLTRFEAKPLLTITGNGTITINFVPVLQVINNTGTIIVDCESEDAYFGSENKNNNIKILTDEFPRLHGGDNVVTFTSGMTIKMKPRWWTI